MLAQLMPCVSQRCHWYVKVGAGLPVQLRGVPVRGCASVAVPVVVGGEEFTGGEVAGGEAGVGALAAVLLPELFVPVTWTTIVKPTSAVTSMYVALVAPLMLAQLTPCVSQRCH